MDKWLQTTERAEMLAALEPLLLTNSTYENVMGSQLGNQRKHTFVDRDIFGDLLASSLSSNDAPRQAPPVYKTAVLTLFGLFLVAWPIEFHLGPVMTHNEVNVWISVLIKTGLSVAANTYIGAPFVTFFFGGWLQRPLSSDARRGHLEKFCVRGLSGVWQKFAAAFVYYLILTVVIICNAAAEGVESTSNAVTMSNTTSEG